MAGRPKKIQPDQQEQIEKVNPTVINGQDILEITISESVVDEAEQTGEENEFEKGIISERSEAERIFDKYEKIEWMPMHDKLMSKYLEKVNEVSDINELLHYIFEKASECSHCTEFGVRIPTSTYALLAARPARVVSYDIGHYPQVDEVEQLCKEVGQDFEFRLENVLTADIEETDLLFIDDFHSEKMLAADLRLHAHKVRKYIIGHDYETYGLIGEQPYNDETSPYGGGRGIKFAVDTFLENNDEWKMEFSTPINNGLFILKRIGTKGRD